MQSISHATRTGNGSRKGGLTLVELMVAMSVLMIGMLALTSSSLAAHTLRRGDHQQQLAGAALHSMMETTRAVSSAALTDITGWGHALPAALAPGGSIGNTFDVPGLEPWEGARSVGTIGVIVDETLTDGELGLDMGLPRDLDNDGAIDNPDVRANARLLPIVISLRWRGVGGDRQLVRGFYVLGY